MMLHPDDFGTILLDHFENPRNAGELENPDAAATVTSAVHLDTLRMTFRVSAGRLESVRFLCRGCPVAIAAASMATTRLTGLTVDEALALRDSEIVDLLGGIPEGRRACSLLVERVVREAFASPDRR